MPKLDTQMGARLQFYRSRALKKIADISRETDISVFVLAQYEQGQRRIDPDDLITICDNFDITIEEFMRGILQ